MNLRPQESTEPQKSLQRHVGFLQSLKWGPRHLFGLEMEGGYKTQVIQATLFERQTRLVCLGKRK